MYDHRTQFKYDSYLQPRKIYYNEPKNKINVKVTNKNNNKKIQT